MTTYNPNRILHHITVNRDGTWEKDEQPDPNYYKSVLEDIRNTQEELKEEIEDTDTVYLGDLDELLEDLSFYESLIQIFERKL